MAKLKTRFPLYSVMDHETNASVAIIHPGEKGTYLVFHAGDNMKRRYLKKKDMEVLAINILKSVNSKRLK